VGSPQTFAQLGIESAQFEFNNLAADTCTFTVGGKAIDAATLWPYGQLLAVIHPNGSRFFVGRVEPWTRDGAPDYQNHLGRLVNPWWYLTKLVYQQRYSIWVLGGAFPTGGYQVVSTPRVVLNILFNGNGTFYQATTGQQIADAIGWAITQGAPIKLGTVDPSTQPFSDFQKGVLCADVIKLMFRKEPDFVVDWDYTTLPYPTVHFRKSQSQTPITIDLTNTTIREQVQIRERPDWIRSYVNITYDQQDTINGQQFLAVAYDLYPNPIPAGVESKFQGVDLYCDLQPVNMTAPTESVAQITTIAIDITSKDTWKRWKPDLSAATVASFSIYLANNGVNPPPYANSDFPAPSIVLRDEYNSNGTVATLDPTCQYELVDGEWADWMPNVNCQRVRITAWVSITRTDGHQEHMQVVSEPTLCNVNTGGSAKTYTLVQQQAQPWVEPVPVGLAKAMWTSWSRLAIEGSFKNVEAVIGTAQTITRSNLLNFNTSSGLVNWSNVNAIVQKISYDCGQGVTSVEFGAPLNLTGNELIDAVRATKFRLTTIDVGYLFGGALSAGGGQVKLARKPSSRATQNGGGATHVAIAVASNKPSPAVGVDAYIKHDGTTGISTWVCPNAPTTSTGAPPVVSSTPGVILDPSKALGSDGNFHQLTLQEQKVCLMVGGVAKQRTVIALVSAPYQAPGDPA